MSLFYTTTQSAERVYTIPEYTNLHDYNNLSDEIDYEDLEARRAGHRVDMGWPTLNLTNGFLRGLTFLRRGRGVLRKEVFDIFKHVRKQNRQHVIRPEPRSIIDKPHQGREE